MDEMGLGQISYLRSKQGHFMPGTGSENFPTPNISPADLHHNQFDNNMLENTPSPRRGDAAVLFYFLLAFRAIQS